MLGYRLASESRKKRRSLRSFMPSQPAPVSPRTILAMIMGGLVVWAVYMAIGAYWYNLNPWRAVVVLVCMGMFLGVWLLLLWTQSRDKKP
jgi:hypothetical protein